METQKKLQSLSDEYSNLQNELSTLVSARSKLESQQQENISVKKEFSALPTTAAVYKLVGPVLLKQDTSEARSTVEGRLDFIEKEIRRIETSINDIQQKSENKRTEIIHLQSQAQQQAGSAATAVA